MEAAPSELLMKKYGARRPLDPQGKSLPCPQLERVWDAVGMTAAVGTDTCCPPSSFDGAYPWSHMRLCNVHARQGRVVSVTYAGEAGFSRDGSNGPVAVEIPLFFTPPRFPGDGYEYWGCSGTRHPGWEVNPAFVAKDGSLLAHTYVAAYEFSQTQEGSLTSCSGRFPAVNLTIGDAREAARRSGAQLYDFCAHAVVEDLCITEFATLYTHSLMTGACDMAYSNQEQDIIRNEADGNLAVVSPEYAAMFAIGQTVGIGLKRGRNQICSARVITAIDPEAGELRFDGEPLPIRAGQFIYTQGWKCGATDAVKSASGSPVSNTAKKYPCKYRGMENLWGNLYKWVDGCWGSDHAVFVCQDPGLYGEDLSVYTRLSYTLAQENGFPTEMGYDPAAPWARLPSRVGGQRDQYTTDFYYQNPGLVTLRTGGHWGTPRASGMLSFAPTSPAEYCGTAITGRLAWRE